MPQTQTSGPSPDRSAAPQPDRIIYRRGYEDGYAQARRDMDTIIDWFHRTGEFPRTHRGTIQWLLRDFNRRGVAT